MRDQKVLAVHGVAIGISGDGLRFKYGDQERNLALARLVGVCFASGTAPSTAAPPHLLTLNTGDTLAGELQSIDNAAVTFVTGWGQSLSLKRREVLKLAVRNGRLVSLSDLTPSAVEQTPYFDRLLPWQIDHALDGTPLKLSDGIIGRGIAVHARTILTYPLDGTFDRFRTRAGFEQPAGRRGNAILRVLCDGKTIFEKLDAKGTDPPIEIDLSVAGGKTLKLEVDFGKDQDIGDRVIWGNARLLRAQQPAAAAKTAATVAQ